MTPVRMELGVHFVEGLEVGKSETASCIFLSCVGWQAVANRWRKAHNLSIDIQVDM